MDTSGKLEAHERESVIRYQSFQDKLDHIDKRLWRLEALMMASTLTIVAAAVGLFLRCFSWHGRVFVCLALFAHLLHSHHG